MNDIINEQIGQKEEITRQSKIDEVIKSLKRH